MKTNSLWLIHGSIKALECKPSILINLDFANSIISPCFFFFIIIIGSFFLIPQVITKMFNSPSELAMSIGMSIMEAKAEIETHAGPAEAKLASF